MNIQEIKKEADKARKRYGAFNSTHESSSVLREEFEEFWDIVKYPYNEDKEAIEYRKRMMIEELKQVASVAYRTIQELENNEIKHI